MRKQIPTLSLIAITCAVFAFGSCGNAEQEAKAKAEVAAQRADSIAQVEAMRNLEALSKEADEVDAEMVKLENDVNALLNN